VADGSRLQKKRNRKRKPLYPKGFDPDNPGPPPDPERWLPKHERAEFKKRRKGRGKNQPVTKGAQVRFKPCSCVETLESQGRQRSIACPMSKPLSWAGSGYGDGRIGWM
jgi:hypothetical protein